MFKPSLRRTVLKQEMCKCETKNNNKVNQHLNQLGQNYNRSRFVPCHKQKTNIPSMLISEELLEHKKFSNNKCYTHTVSPLSYDFHQYPKAIRQIMKNHFQQIQIGVSQQVFYASHDNMLYFWKEDKPTQQITPRPHKFQQKIEIVKVFVVKNPLLFKAEQLTILAISFENRVQLFSIDQNDFSLTDLMIKYKLGRASKVNKIQYTQNCELIMCGNNGQICMISFSSSKESIVQVKSNPLKKYFSPKSFDYYSEYITKQVSIFNNFVYCLTQKNTKTNIVLYGLKKFFSIFIGGKVQQITQKTYIDVYKLNEGRTSMIFIDRLDQKQIQEKVKSSYANYSGQYIDDGFKIASLIQSDLQIQSKQSYYQSYSGNQKQQNKVQRMLSQDEISGQSDDDKQQKMYSYIFRQSLSFITKCGYVITIKHRDNFQAKDNRQKIKTKRQKNQPITNFSFQKQPFKILQNLQRIALVDTIKINKSLHEKEFRKNFVITSKGFNNLTIMNDMLLYFGNKSISLINYNEIKPAIYERSTKLTQKPIGYYDQQNIYCEMQNLQKQWIVFSKEGHQKIYEFKPRHILLSYLYFKCQTEYRPSGQKSQKSQYLDRVLDFDDKFHRIIQKLIKIYGYYEFNKIIVELLLNFNKISKSQSSKKTEYVIIQKEIVQNLVSLQFKQQKYRAFDDWFYQLGRNKGIKIVQTQRISFYLWTLLMEYQYYPTLQTEFQAGQKPLNLYNRFYQELGIEAVNNKRYSSYGYSLKTIFYQIIEPILKLRAKQYKQKYLQIKNVEDNLKVLLFFLQQKNKKQQDRRYKNYSVQKIDSYNIQKMKTDKKSMGSFDSKKLANQSVSTNYTNQTLLYQTQQQANQNNFENQKFIQRSISQVEEKIYRSIKKILVLIQVFSKLIQTDQRAKQGQHIPTFGQVMTSYKSQIFLGDVFFKEQVSVIFSQQNTQNLRLIANIFNSPLIKDIQEHLPQLGISEKISYINFKKAKSILWACQGNSTQNIRVDIRSLDMESLAQITNSSHILEMRMLFMGSSDIKSVVQSYNQGGIQNYLQFIIIGIQKIIQKHDYLSNLRKTYDQKPKFNRVSYLKLMQDDLKRQSHIAISQQTQFLQMEIKLFYDQVKTVFTTVLQKFNEITGKQYYKVEKTLQFIIEIVVSNCYMDQVVMQFLEHGLKRYKLIQKVMRMKKLEQKIRSNSTIQTQKVIIIRKSGEQDEIKQFIKQNEPSTMQLYQKMSKRTENTTIQTCDSLLGNGLFSKTQLSSQMQQQKY